MPTATVQPLLSSQQPSTSFPSPAAENYDVYVDCNSGCTVAFLHFHGEVLQLIILHRAQLSPAFCRSNLGVVAACATAVRVIIRVSPCDWLVPDARDICIHASENVGWEWG